MRIVTTLLLLILMWGTVEAQWMANDPMAPVYELQDQIHRQQEQLDRIENELYRPPQEPYRIPPMPKISAPYTQTYSSGLPASSVENTLILCEEGLLTVTDCEMARRMANDRCYNSNSTEGLDPERRARLCAMGRLPECECDGPQQSQEQLPPHWNPYGLKPLEWERIGNFGCVERTVDHDGILLYRKCEG